MGVCAGLCVFSCPTAVPAVVLVVVALFLCKSPLPNVARKFICSSSNVADMVVPTLDNRGNIKTQTMPYLCLRLVFLQIRRQLVGNKLGLTTYVLRIVASRFNEIFFGFSEFWKMKMS